MMADGSIRADLLSLKGATIEWFGFRVDPGNLPLRLPGLYLIIYSLTGKPYIGIAEDVFRRLRAHAKGNSPKKLKAAIAKHGKGNFLIIPLYYSTDGTPGLEIIEAEMIAYFDAIDAGYNICAAKGRVGPYGAAHSAAVKAGQTAEGRARTTDAAKRNYARTAEKLHAAREAANNSPEGRAAAAARITARWADPEWRANTIAKIKAAKAGTKARRSAKIKGIMGGCRRAASENPSDIPRDHLDARSKTAPRR